MVIMNVNVCSMIIGIVQLNNTVVNWYINKICTFLKAHTTKTQMKNLNSIGSIYIDTIKKKKKDIHRARVLAVSRHLALPFLNYILGSSTGMTEIRNAQSDRFLKYWTST